MGMLCGLAKKKRWGANEGNVLSFETVNVVNAWSGRHCEQLENAHFVHERCFAYSESAFISGMFSHKLSKTLGDPVRRYLLFMHLSGLRGRSRTVEVSSFRFIQLLQCSNALALQSATLNACRCWYILFAGKRRRMSDLVLFSRFLTRQNVQML